MSALHSQAKHENDAATAEKLRERLEKIAREEASVREQLSKLSLPKVSDLPSVETTSSSSNIDLGDCIQRHLFSLQPPAFSDISTSESLNLLAVSPVNGDIFILTNNNQLVTTTSLSLSQDQPCFRTVSLQLKKDVNNGTHGSSTQPAILPPEARLTSCFIDALGTSLVLFGPTELFVVKLLDTATWNSSLLPSGTLFDLGASVHESSGGGGGIVDVMWHKLSSHHLVVLTKQYVQLHHVESGNIEIQVDMLVNMDGSSSSKGSSPRSVVPAALSCGSEHGWNLFTLFVLMECGRIYSLCPFIPNKVSIGRKQFHELLSECSTSAMDAWRDASLHEQNNGGTEEYKSHKKKEVWLKRHFEDTNIELSLEKLSITPMTRISSSQHTSSSSSSSSSRWVEDSDLEQLLNQASYDQDLEAGNIIQPHLLVNNKKLSEHESGSNSSSSGYAPARSFLNLTSSHAYKNASLAAFPLFVIVNSQGTLDVKLCMEEILPTWLPTTTNAIPTTMKTTTLVLCDEVRSLYRNALCHSGGTEHQLGRNSYDEINESTNPSLSPFHKLGSKSQLLHALTSHGLINETRKVLSALPLVSFSEAVLPNSSHDLNAAIEVRAVELLLLSCMFPKSDGGDGGGGLSSSTSNRSLTPTSRPSLTSPTSRNSNGQNEIISCWQFAEAIQASKNHFSETSKRLFTELKPFFDALSNSKSRQEACEQCVSKELALSIAKFLGIPILFGDASLTNGQSSDKGTKNSSFAILETCSCLFKASCSFDVLDVRKGNTCELWTECCNWARAFQSARWDLLVSILENNSSSNCQPLSKRKEPKVKSFPPILGRSNMKKGLFQKPPNVDAFECTYDLLCVGDDYCGDAASLFKLFSSKLLSYMSEYKDATGLEGVSMFEIASDCFGVETILSSLDCLRMQSSHRASPSASSLSSPNSFQTSTRERASSNLRRGSCNRDIESEASRSVSNDGRYYVLIGRFELGFTGGAAPTLKMDPWAAFPPIVAVSHSALVGVLAIQGLDGLEDDLKKQDLEVKDEGGVKLSSLTGGLGLGSDASSSLTVAPSWRCRLQQSLHASFQLVSSSKPSSNSNSSSRYIHRVASGLLGCEILSSPAFGRLLVCWSGDGGNIIVNLSLLEARCAREDRFNEHNSLPSESSSLSSLSSPTASAKGKASGEMKLKDYLKLFKGKPMTDKREDILSELRDIISHITSTPAITPSAEMTQVGLEVAPLLRHYRELMDVLEKGYLMKDDHMDLLSQLSDKLVKESKGKVSEIVDQSFAVSSKEEKRVKDLLERGRVSREKAKNLLSAVLQAMPSLSKAEVQYKLDLEKMSKDMLSLKAYASQLEKKVNQHRAKFDKALTQPDDTSSKSSIGASTTTGGSSSSSSSSSTSLNFPEDEWTNIVDILKGTNQSLATAQQQLVEIRGKVEARHKPLSHASTIRRGDFSTTPFKPNMTLNQPFYASPSPAKSISLKASSPGESDDLHEPMRVIYDIDI